MYIAFNVDGVYNSSSSISSTGYLNTGYSCTYYHTGDIIADYCKGILYSDYPVKYKDLTVYQPSNNKAVSIADIIELGAGDGSGEIVGPQKLPTHDNILYGQYMDKNEETWSAFIQWLIDTEQYMELQYGLPMHCC